MAQDKTDARPENVPGKGEGTQITKPLKSEDAAKAEEEAKDDDEEEFTDVDSSWVSSYRYLKSEEILEVVFHNGHKEQYSASNDVAERFKTASSKGQFIWKHWPPER